MAKDSKKTKNPHDQEFTFRSVAAGLVVAAIMGASYPYIVLKLGFGPNVSVVAAFLGYLIAKLFFKNFHRRENNIIQTAGTSAAQTAFMCVLLAAFDFLNANTSLNFHFVLEPWQTFLWLSTGGILGVLLAVPLRRLFIEEQNLPFPDGIAAAETIIALDADTPAAKKSGRVLGLGALASGAVMIIQSPPLNWMPDVINLGARGASMGVGLSLSLLNLGSGMLVGFRINLSMLIGTILAWVIAPEILSNYGIVTTVNRLNVLKWVMWPATGLLISSGLTQVCIQWKSIADTFKNFSVSRSDAHQDFPIKWVVIGILLSGAGLIVVQSTLFNIQPWMTVIAIVFSLPLMIVGLRVLGETNWGPISSLSNMMQGIFGFIAPGHIMANMVSSGTTGIIATESEALMQDYKCGQIVKSSPKHMTYAQLLAVPVGAAAVAYMYPVLKKVYGVGGEHGLASPISQKWAGFAELLSKGFSALPQGAMGALVVFTILGIIITILEQRWKKFVPSPAGMGIGMLVPGMYVITMFIGGCLEVLWRKKNNAQADRYMAPLSSGLIGGEAIVAVILSILIFTGLLSG